MGTFAFIVGTITSDHVIVEVSGYKHPGAEDKVEANRLAASVSVAAGAWKGRLRGVEVTNHEIAAFHKQLEHLMKDNKGQAAFEPLEAYLVLKLNAGEGMIDVSGVAFDQPDGHNALAFNWALDPAQLKPLLKQLKDIEAAFPVLK